MRGHGIRRPWPGAPPPRTRATAGSGIWESAGHRHWHWEGVRRMPRVGTRRWVVHAHVTLPQRHALPQDDTRTRIVYELWLKQNAQFSWLRFCRARSQSQPQRYVANVCTYIVQTFRRRHVISDWYQREPFPGTEVLRLPGPGSRLPARSSNCSTWQRNHDVFSAAVGYEFDLSMTITFLREAQMFLCQGVGLAPLLRSQGEDRKNDTEEERATKSFPLLSWEPKGACHTAGIAFTFTYYFQFWSLINCQAYIFYDVRRYNVSACDTTCQRAEQSEQSTSYKHARWLRL